MKLFDTHTHLSDEKYNDCRDEVIERMHNAGVDKCIEVCCDIRNTEISRMLVANNDGIYLAYGMHPHYVSYMNEELTNKLEQLILMDKCVALGEIGLDYHYDFSEKAEQKKWFDKQLNFAKNYDKPVILHIREAFGDCMDILNSYKGTLTGVMHCFSGSYEIAKRCIDMGLYIAFGGSVTFNNASNLREVAKKLPIDRLLLETDCPYMTPVPLRGNVNEPKNVCLVAEKLAELHNISEDEIAYITYNNALKLFRI